MYEKAKHEFLTWVNTLDTEQLSEHKITMISILINNFEEVASVGVASGQRARLLGEKISGLKGNVVKVLPKYEINKVWENDIERIESLDVEKFRGFGTVQNFKFDNQYTFFYGPNGSGKTSFCEALEYCMLGSIEEATARNINTEKYIVHAGEKRGQKPILKCKYSSGNVQQCTPDYSRFRFGFIEKNRIDGFSHLSATTEKTQTDRMAALFGLSEFRDFVKGFSSADVLGNNKYIKIEPSAHDDYQQAVRSIEFLEKQLEDVKNNLKTENDKLSSLIAGLKIKNVKTAEDAEKYFTDSKEGLITKLTVEAENNKWIVFEKCTLETLYSDIANFTGYFDEIKKCQSEILSDVSAVNFVDLFNAVVKLDAKSHDRCPVCLTPLSKVETNPFEYSRNELERLKKIESAKKTVRDYKKKIIENYERVFKAIIKIKKADVLGDVEYSIFENKSFQIIDRDELSTDDELVLDELKKIKKNLESEDLAQKVDEYNAKALEYNKNYDKKLDEVQKSYRAIVETKSKIDVIQKNYDLLEKGYSKKKNCVEKIAERAEAEKKEVSFNKKMVEAYRSVVDELYSYIEKLPSDLAQNLSDKVQEYYNCINEDDADFELIKKLHLPLSPKEKIMIEMEDGISRDALLILSEGHVKILGLSILLAKANYERIPFMIFDDIVNSIDDDHRDGVAKLLMTHSDFSNVQMILTCHGEIFVSMLEEYVSASKSKQKYMFLPADTLDERGVFIICRESSIPLDVARENFKTNQLKDCAMNCRRAVECIVSKLWKELAPYINGGISVKLHDLKRHPDLYSITNALIKYTDNKYVQNAGEINNDLKKLTRHSTWSKLNKGTHEDKSISEFNRGDVKELLELVAAFAKHVNDVKFKVSIKE